MRYHNITKDDMLNGDGLRVVLWTAGCSHKCEGCHNPITWDANGGIPFDESAKEEIFNELRKDYVSGITFSGGDPLYPSNIDDIENLINEIKIKFPNKTIWLYTGFDWESIKTLEFISNVDILIDGKFKIDLLDKQLEWKGSSNQRIIDVKKSLKNNSVQLYK